MWCLLSYLVPVGVEPDVDYTQQYSDLGLTAARPGVCALQPHQQRPAAPPVSHRPEGLRRCTTPWRPVAFSQASYVADVGLNVGFGCLGLPCMELNEL